MEGRMERHIEGRMDWWGARIGGVHGLVGGMDWMDWQEEEGRHGRRRRVDTAGGGVLGGGGWTRQGAPKIRKHHGSEPVVHEAAPARLTAPNNRLLLTPQRREHTRFRRAQGRRVRAMRMPGLPARAQLLRSTQEQLTVGQDKGQRKDDVGKPNVATLRSTLLSLTPRCRRTTPVAHVLADSSCVGHEKSFRISKPKPRR